jgi:hypothetical protein
MFLTLAPLADLRDTSANSTIQAGLGSGTSTRSWPEVRLYLAPKLREAPASTLPVIENDNSKGTSYVIGITAKYVPSQDLDPNPMVQGENVSPFSIIMEDARPVSENAPPVDVIVKSKSPEPVPFTTTQRVLLAVLFTKLRSNGTRGFWLESLPAPVTLREVR